MLAACSVQPTTNVQASGAVSTAQVAVAPAASPTVDCSVELYGDSILHGGYAITKRLAEPPAMTLKRRRPVYTVVDHTGNGETANARSATFKQETRSARFVVIEHGLNDAAQALPLEPALLSMVRTAQAEGRTVILTGLSRQVIPLPGREQYDATIRKVAASSGAAFADWGSVDFRAEEMADILHPGKSYSDRLIERIISVLDERAPECRQRTIAGPG